MVTCIPHLHLLDFNDFATRGTTTDVERYKKQSAEFRKKVNTTTPASTTKSAAVVPAKGKQAEEEDPDDEESYDSMDYGDEFNDDEESAYKKEKIGE